MQAAWPRAQGWAEPCGVMAGGWRRAGCWKAVLLSNRGCLGFEMVFIQSFGLRLSPPLVHQDKGVPAVGFGLSSGVFQQKQAQLKVPRH